MTTAATYSFRHVSPDDLALLQSWHTAPHVREWWGEAEPYDDAALADPRVRRCIVSLGDRPFAFMQDYTVHGWPDHHFADLPKGARGVDQYIGDAAMVGCGHGQGFIRERMQTLFNEGAPAIATDPHPDNARAIAVYTKLGFRPTGPAQMTKWGLILPMTVWR